jgi:TonB-linked SusC/RagA family outer membrane protein
MKKLIQKLLFCTFLCFCGVITASAQQKKVTGIIKDSVGVPIVNASVRVKGTTNGIATGADGSFSISVNGANSVLVISSVNFKSKEVPVGQDDHLEIVLQADDKIEQGVIVTALGIKRQKKSLGYAVQEVKGETLSDIKDPNLTNELTGQIAGVQIVRSGNGPAGSSQIRLRGNNSLTDISQPLIVVDGVPVSNNTGRVGVKATNDFYNPSLDNGNGLSDINPDDIATLTVLKGPAGAALYGSLGGNGVILITTKSGQKQPGAGISISSSVGFESIFTRPKMQNAFGQGSDGKYDAAASSLSWGPAMTGQTVTDWQGNSVPLEAHDNTGNYLKNGVISTQNISFQQQFNATSVYASYSRMDDKSIIPGATLARNNITARAVTKLGQNQRWTIDTKVQFINATAKNRPSAGVNTSNIFATLNTLPRSIDITTFRHSVDSTGNMTWYSAQDKTTNPYWASKYQLNQDTRNRFILYGSLKYQFTSWLDAQLTGSADMYTTSSNAKTYAGNFSNPPGSYSISNDNYYQTNYSTLITAKKDNLFGKLGGSLTVGGNLQSYRDDQFSAGAGTLRVPNLFTVNNAQGNPTFKQLFASKAINSVYASLEANYDGYLFLNATWRNDWSSALSKANRSFSYPSVNLSYVFTDMIQSKGGNLPSWFSYGKLRAGYATAGSDLDPYKLNNTYFIGLDPNNNTTAYSGTTLFNPNIKSQLIKSSELGAEMRFLKNVLGFDFTWYKSNATNQLITLPMDPLSGYTGAIVNSGNIQNTGVEISADARILPGQNPNTLGWTMSVNYAHNNNTVKSIYPGIEKYQLGGFDQISVLAVAGQRYGQIYGTKLLRVTDPKDANYGKMIVSGAGLPQATPGDTLLGNQQAKHIIGLTNKFSYKHFTLSVLLDASLGGKMFSLTLSSMESAGTAAATVVNGKRDSMVVAGVVSTGANQYAPNTTRISPQQYWTALGAGNTGITEPNLYDASNIRVRNIQLSYSLPKNVIKQTPIQRASLTVSCNNVWMISSHMHGLDPESSYATGGMPTSGGTTGTAIGFENGSAPTTRTYYVTLSLGF